MAKSVLYNIYADLTTALIKVVDAKCVFPKDRPSTTDSALAKFAVIDLPASISDIVVGRNKTMLLSSGVFYLFVQAKKDGTLNLGATGTFVDDVVGLFPIKGDYCVAKEPVVRMTGSDGKGFQVVTITFDLYSRWRAFEEE